MAALFAGAAPAGAHAELSSTEPRSGEILRQAPERIRLNFSEPVTAGSGAIRLFDAAGERVTTPPAQRPEGAPGSVEVELPQLDEGGYVVTWRAVSADSHPLNGAFTFRVGDSATAAEGALVERLLAAQGGDPLVGLVHGLARLLAYVGLLGFMGGAAFLMVVWPQGRPQRRPQRILWGAWGLGFVGTLAVFALQGAYGEGLGVVAGLDPDVLGPVATSRFGTAWLARLGLLVIAGLVVRRAFAKERPTGRSMLSLAATTGVALAATPALAGHAAAGSPAAVLVALDTIHFSAAAWWLGGLGILVGAALRSPLGDEVPGAARRFSRQAFWAVVILVVTGSAQGFVHTGSPAALTDTLYGQLLAGKVLLFVVIVGLAAAGRRFLRRRDESSQPADLGRLRRSAGAEVIVAVVLLVVTALLVNLIPARTALALPATGELTAGSTLVEITVEPAEAGPIDLHLYSLTPQGQVTEVEEMTAEFRLDEADIDLEVPLQRAGPGHFAAYGFDLPISGKWTLEVAVRAEGITIDRGRTTFQIR